MSAESKFYLPTIREIREIHKITTRSARLEPDVPRSIDLSKPPPEGFVRVFRGESPQLIEGEWRPRKPGDDEGAATLWYTPDLVYAENKGKEVYGLHIPKGVARECFVPQRSESEGVAQFIIPPTLAESRILFSPLPRKGIILSRQ